MREESVLMVLSRVSRTQSDAEYAFDAATKPMPRTTNEARIRDLTIKRGYVVRYDKSTNVGEQLYVDCSDGKRRRVNDVTPELTSWELKQVRAAPGVGRRRSEQRRQQHASALSGG